MKKVGVCGHFGGGKNLLNGQTIKTKSVADALKARLGEGQVAAVDTHGGAKALPRLIVQSLLLEKKCENIVIMPAHKGLRILAPLYSFYNLFFHRKIHYVVIGGWLPRFIDRHSWLAGILKKYEGIYVETSTMKRALESRGFTNAAVMPNFKDLDRLTPQELEYQTEPPYKLCTFSRVMREKGIGDAAAAVRAVNEESGRVVYTLDIYGQVDRGCAKEFTELQKTFPAYVRYRGEVPYEESVGTLKEYFALLFPTRFFTEGVPGTIIDAYAAGVPVISSRWESFADVVEDGKTGVGYTFGEPAEMKGILDELLRNPQKLADMKPACLRAAEKFTPEAALEGLLCKLA